MSRVQISKAQKEKAAANRKSGIDQVFTMTVQYYYDMAVHLGECNDVDISLEQADTGPKILLTAIEGTDTKNLQEFWETLWSCRPEDRTSVNLNTENKSITFESIDRLAQFFLFYTQKYVQGLAAGQITPNQKPIESFKEPSVLNLHRDFYCSHEDVGNTISRMRAQLGKNPLLHFVYTSYDLQRAIQAVNNDYAGKKSSTYAEVLRFQ